MDPFTLTAAAALFGGLLGKANSNNQISSQQVGKLTADDFRALMEIPELRELINLQLGQARRSDALNIAKMGGLWDMMPIHMKAGTTRPGSTRETGGAAGPSLRSQGTVNRNRPDNLNVPADRERDTTRSNYPKMW